MLRTSRLDRRFQVFISSTFEDLQEQRKQAIEVVFERGHIPIALERFSAANDSDLEVIRRAIQDSQVYVLILGHRYGEIVPGRDISFTELEYEIAEESKLLILPFVLRNEEVTKRRQALDPKVTKDKRELENFSRLEKFRTRISRFRQLWGPDDQFKFLLVNALNDNLPTCEKRGFVREPDDLELVDSLQNAFIVDIVAELRSFEKLYDRCSIDSEAKRECARFFREIYVDGLVKHKVSLFFESGSTVAHVARELSATLGRTVRIKDGRPNIQVATNNVLAYLQLWLKAKIPCTTFPWSPPSEQTYGASYGGLEKLEPQTPRYDLRPLDAAAKEYIRRLLETAYTLTSFSEPRLLLGAASGLQVGAEHRLRFKEGLSEEAKTQLQGQLGNCFGPHVGSYHNKIFKRFMYATRIPIMIFLTGSKVDCEIDVGRCHFILDKESSWQAFCREHPVAFCVGCEQELKEKLASAFAGMGFDVVPGGNARPVSALIARNSRFIEEFEQQVGSA